MVTKGWNFKEYVTKLIKQGIQIFVAWIVGHNLSQYGITIDEVVLSAAIWAGLETIRSVAKHKFGFSWL